jgi:predicted thioesterase
MKKNIYSVGDTLEYRRKIISDDVARFHGKVIHPVYATFALARDAEWTSRQFVLQLSDEDEEGIGTSLTIEHKTPAFVGEVIVFTAQVHKLTGNELICAYEARVGERLVATGMTGQKILKREIIKKLFDKRPDNRGK